MIAEEQQDQAALYVLGLLEGTEVAGFAAAMTADPELRDLVHELREAAGTLAFAAPPEVVPPALKTAVMKQTGPRREHASVFTNWVPWAIAAALALCCTLLLFGRTKFSRTIAAQAQQIASLNKQREGALNEMNFSHEQANSAQVQIARLSAERDALTRKIAQLEKENEESRVEAAKLTADRDALKDRVSAFERNANVIVATLTSKLSTAPQALATITWDTAKQQGVLRAEDLPPNRTDQDYQLWIADPNYKDPVNGGVFSVTKSGNAEIVFRPNARVTSAKAFLVSLERKGGVTKAQGPIVLAGNL
ncbi:MAG: hypothetical protein DLM52_11665 [Chthoniobacterales bacterium]|nr:MAG: hypothetical protein DLM52_11665 [Chthoniobacterales bacterium]